MSPEAKKWLGVGIGCAAVLVLVIVAGLAFVVMGLSRARSVSRRTVCATNLKALGGMTAIRAAGAADSIVPPPSPAFGGTWMCDQPAGFTDSLIAAIALPPATDPRKFFYCPSNPNQTVAALWAVMPYRVTGYVWTNDRTGEPAYALPPLAAVPGGMPPITYHTNWLATPMSTSSELVTDWVISQTPAPATATWLGIASPPRPGPYDTSHMATSTKPGGGNSLYFDGHVTWTPFNPARAIPVQQGGGPAAPYFWFPNP